MNLKVEALKYEIQELAPVRQGIYEIDGLTWSTFNVLQSFEEEDWYSLKKVVHTWSYPELEVLTLAMVGYDNEEGLCIEHNFIFYLFYFIDYGNARTILSWSDEFFDDDFLTLELIHEIRAKLQRLLDAKWIEERAYNYWKNKIDVFEKMKTN